MRPQGKVVRIKICKHKRERLKNSPLKKIKNLQKKRPQRKDNRIKKCKANHNKTKTEKEINIMMINDMELNMVAGGSNTEKAADSISTAFDVPKSVYGG